MKQIEKDIQELKEVILEQGNEKKTSFLEVISKIALPGAVVILSALTYWSTDKINEAILNESQQENLRVAQRDAQNREAKYIEMIYDQLFNSSGANDKINALALLHVVSDSTVMKIQQGIENGKFDLEVKRAFYQFKLGQNFRQDQGLIAESTATQKEAQESEWKKSIEKKEAFTNVRKNIKKTDLSINVRENVEQITQYSAKLLSEPGSETIDSILTELQMEAEVDEPNIGKVNEIKDYLLEEIESSSASNWAKAGYYRMHPDNFRIGIAEVNVGTKTASIRISNSSGEQVSFFEELDAGQDTSFAFDNRSYRLTLDKIDAAGKNPFTKAAFYTITEIK